MKSVQDQQQSSTRPAESRPNSAAAPNATGTATPPTPPPPCRLSRQRPPRQRRASWPPVLRQTTHRRVIRPSLQTRPAGRIRPIQNSPQRLHGRPYALATSEFGEVIRSSPNDPLAGNSLLLSIRRDRTTGAGKYATAIKDYDHVLEQFPNNAKGPSRTCTRGRPSSRQASERLASPNCAHSSPASQTPGSRPGTQQTQRHGRSHPRQDAQISSSSPHSTCNAAAQRLSW